MVIVSSEEHITTQKISFQSSHTEEYFLTESVYIRRDLGTYTSVLEIVFYGSLPNRDLQIRFASLGV